MKKKLFWKLKRSRDHNPFLIQEGNILDENIEEISRKHWVENAWIPDKGEGGVSTSISEFIGKSASQKRIKIIMIGLFLILFLILIRSFYLQIFSGEKFKKLAENNRLRFEPIVAERGIIYDRNLRPLVSNVPSFNLVLMPQDLPKDQNKRKEILAKIAQIGKLDQAKLEEKLQNTQSSFFQYISLMENLDYEKALSLIMQGSDIPGMGIEQVYNRHYLLSPEVKISTSTSAFLSNKTDRDVILSLSHLLGYTGKINKDELSKNHDYLLTDDIGKTGLEKFYEKDLRGKYGEKAIEVDALGKEKNVIKISPPVVGKNLILTINLAYQKKLEEFLTQELKASQKQKAVAILMNPNNGEILALVNWPSFNNNLFASGISDQDYQKLTNDETNPLFPRAWSGQYPSGSTIKTLYAAAALNEKIIDKNTSLLSDGGIKVDKWFFPDWKAGGHGLTSVRKAIAESVNTFFYYIGGGYQHFSGLGLERVIAYLQKFKFGEKLGIDLPEEATGFIPSREWKLKTKKEPWYIGDTYNLSIGQGDLLVTPLQIASLTAAIANGGTIYQPHLVSAFSDNITKEVNNIGIKTLASNLIPDEYLKVVREGMRQTITSGSAQSLGILPITVAGKTGTAQWAQNKENHAWFTCFAPFEKPELVLTILIEEGGEGSSVAVPVVKQFLSWYSANNR